MTSTTDRQHYRALVAQVAAKAKGVLPQEVNGRLEGAVALVLMDDVHPQADGSIQVGSCTDPTRTYRLVGTACECKDFTDGKAPQGWCRHRIAAGLHKRVSELLAQAPAAPPAAPTVPLPEAPVSITLKATLHGHEVMVTLRGVDFASVKAQVEQASQWLSVQAPPQPPAQCTTQLDHDESPYCHRHKTALKRFSKDGRSWFSHKTADGHWCKGQ
jgi:hypothetical protein